MISSSKIPTSAIDARLEREAQARAAAVAEAGYVPAASALRARIADLLSLRDRAVHPRPKLGRPGSAWLKLVVLDGRLARTLEPGSRARESREFARRDLRDVVLTMSREPGFPPGDGGGGPWLRAPG